MLIPFIICSFFFFFLHCSKIVTFLNTNVVEEILRFKILHLRFKILPASDILATSHCVTKQ